MNDVLVIGAGPGGLSAAINAAAEGLSTTLLDSKGSCGGQAVTSSRIENYLGHKDGIAGLDLIESAVAQAQRLGVVIAMDERVEAMRKTAKGFEVTTHQKHTFASSAIIIAAGLDWRKLDIEAPILRYNALPADLISHDKIAIIGAANSAGQAALHAAEHDTIVHLLARRTLGAGMSAYLVERIVQHPNIVVHEQSQVREANGEYIVTSQDKRLDVGAAFVYIGAAPPATPYLTGLALRDEKGYVLTKPESYAVIGSPGVFAVGDIRSGSRKRVAAASGEGAIAAAEVWQFIHQSEAH